MNTHHRPCLRCVDLFGHFTGAVLEASAGLSDSDILEMLRSEWARRTDTVCPHDDGRVEP